MLRNKSSANSDEENEAGTWVLCGRGLDGFSRMAEARLVSSLVSSEDRNILKDTVYSTAENLTELRAMTNWNYNNDHYNYNEVVSIQKWSWKARVRFQNSRTRTSLYLCIVPHKRTEQHLPISVASWYPEKTCCLPKDLPPSLSCVHGTSPCLTHFTSHQVKF